MAMLWLLQIAKAKRLRTHCHLARHSIAVRRPTPHRRTTQRKSFSDQLKDFYYLNIQLVIKLNILADKDDLINLRKKVPMAKFHEESEWFL